MVIVEYFVIRSSDVSVGVVKCFNGIANDLLTKIKRYLAFVDTAHSHVDQHENNTGWPIKNAPNLNACLFTFAIDRNLICTHKEQSILR